MKRGYQATPSIFLAVVKDDQVLLTKRKNTGFMDGYYDLPSGHVEEGEPLIEAAKRELTEETSLTTTTEELRLIHVGQSSFTPSSPYIYFVFKVLKWQGQPKNVESDLSDDVAFYPLDNLPKTVPHIIEALKNLDGDKVTFEFITLTEEEFLRQ